MKYYIVDDNFTVIKSLEKIVETKKLGEVIGFSTNPSNAILEILKMNPDIVLVDLLMGKMDGISLVRTIKEQRPNLSFVMISQVADKEMVANAYKAGVEFFINKPVNIIEVESVLRKLAEQKKMEAVVKNIRGVMDTVENNTKAPSNEDNNRLNTIKTFLSIIGLLGESGTPDVLNLCDYLIENDLSYTKNVLEDYCTLNNKNVKNVEQRMRRAIKKGMSNVAHTLTDDYGSDVVREYSSYVFEYRSIKEEMDVVLGKSELGGRVNVSKFFDGLLAYRELEN
ncbi:MAG: DNA-binding domain-containing protein [Peptostreptococcaceae bacterium]|nr:DNA-binding domain-containing protein [Peptostreptococcaceae bacterium]